MVVLLYRAGQEFVRKRIVSAETYLIYDAGERPVGDFCGRIGKMKRRGVRHGLDGKAGYVHGLAVSRRAAGKGLGYLLLELASKLIAKISRR